MKERHDRLVELNKPLHRALKHAESNLNDVQKAGAPHKTAKKVVAEIQGVLRVLEKQSNHLFFGATYGWDKLDNALNHSHLPSSTKKFAKKLGVKAGDVSKVRLHRYICLWWASERKLGKKACNQTKKTLEKSREQG